MGERGIPTTARCIRLELSRWAAQLDRSADGCIALRVRGVDPLFPVGIEVRSRERPEQTAEQLSASQLLRAAKAWAALDGRDYVIPDDVQALTGPVLAHRLLLTADASIGGRSPEDVLTKVVTAVPIPAPDQPGRR